MNTHTILLAGSLLLPGTALADVQTTEAETDAPPSAAETRTPAGKLTFDAGVGFKHDSNVAVLELDTSSGQGDYAALLDLGAGYRHRLTEKATVRADYALSHTEYDEFTDFNLTIHRGSIDLGYDLEAVDAGLTYHYIDARLDSDGFLTMNMASAYLARLVNDRVYLRGAYTWTDKAFEDNTARDAVAHAASADVYLFLNGLTTYLTLGARLADEQAEAREFDYLGAQVSAQITHKVALLDTKLQLKGRLRYEARDYRHVTPAIGQERDEDRYRFDLAVAVPLGDRFTATAQYEHANNQSNLPSVDFAEDVFSVRLDLSL